MQCTLVFSQIISQHQAQCHQLQILSQRPQLQILSQRPHSLPNNLLHLLAQSSEALSAALRSSVFSYARNTTPHTKTQTIAKPPTAPPMIAPRGVEGCLVGCEDAETEFVVEDAETEFVVDDTELDAGLLFD